MKYKRHKKTRVRCLLQWHFPLSNIADYYLAWLAKDKIIFLWDIHHGSEIRGPLKLRKRWKNSKQQELYSRCVTGWQHCTDCLMAWGMKKQKSLWKSTSNWLGIEGTWIELSCFRTSWVWSQTFDQVIHHHTMPECALMHKICNQTPNVHIICKKCAKLECSAVSIHKKCAKICIKVVESLRCCTSVS